MNTLPRFALLPSISAAFDDLLAREINIAPGIRSKASASQNHLRGFLVSERTRDSTFPRVLVYEDGDFLGGSFARHSKIWPLDDIDLYVPLDGYGLVYHRYGLRLPYTVVTDGILTANPLAGARWMTAGALCSTTLVRGFAAVLKRHYGEASSVYTYGSCVSIRFTHGETDDEDGLGYDVVPCFALKPDNPQEMPFYLMPDGQGGWIHTNPRLDTEISAELQAFHNGLYRRVVKLLKYWNKQRYFSLFSSYYVELALAREFRSRQMLGAPITSVAEGLAVAFGALGSACWRGDLASWVQGAPAVRAPTLSMLQKAELSQIAGTAGAALQFEKNGNNAEALKQWRDIFGDKL